MLSSEQQQNHEGSNTKKREIGFFSVLLRIPNSLKAEIERVQYMKGFSTRTSSFIYVLQTGIESLKRQELELETQKPVQVKEPQEQKRVAPRAWWEKDLVK